MVPPVIPIIAAAAVSAAASFVVGTISKLLQPKIDQPKISDQQLSNQQQTVSVRDPIKPREKVYGKTRKGGTIVEFITSTGNSAVLNIVVAWAGHECEKVGKVYFNEDLAFDEDSVEPEPKFAGKAGIIHYVGTDTQNADPGLISRVSRWTTNHKLRGICYSIIVLTFDRDLYAGIPNFSAEIYGAKVYDPRVPTTAWSDNAALCQADYLNDSLYGLGVPYSDFSPAPDIDSINVTDLITAANVCDEMVNIDESSPPTQEKRYTLNGIVDSSEDPETIIEKMATASYGKPLYVGGEWIVRAGEYTAPTEEYDEDDLRGNMVTQARVPNSDLFNATRGVFISPKNNYQPADFPPKTYSTFETQDNGERIWRDLDLPFTNSEFMAQRIAKIHLFSNREQISVVYPCSLKGLQNQVGDTIMVTNTIKGWNQKPFFITDWGFTVNQDEEGNPVFGTVFNLREISSAVFDITASEQDLIAAAPDTLLPSPAAVEFWAVQVNGRGQFATSSVVAGFEAIRKEEQYPSWTGRVTGWGEGGWGDGGWGFGSESLTGLVYNPLTGHLNCDDQNLATGNDFNVFDSYVVTPVINPQYEAKEISISFDDMVRLSCPMTVEKGPGETGSFTGNVQFDYRLDAGAYGGFSPLRVLSATAKFFKFRVIFDTSEGAAMILKRFAPTIAKRLVIQKASQANVPIGGKGFVFDQPYHNIPKVGVNVLASAGRSGVISDLQATEFSAKVFSNSTDVGGTISWRAEGV